MSRSFLACLWLVSAFKEAVHSRLAASLLLSVIVGGPVTGAPKDSPPLPPAEALAQFQVEPGYRIELVAAEPLVQSPCALAWDEAGRLFVAENRGYPVGSPDGTPQGRIALLQDTRGDGRIDKRTEFAGGFMFPNGLLPWRGGLLVTDAPDLLWLSDTNGDGLADVREVWFTGFGTNQTTQLRACYPTLGPDGWIYVSRGWSGGVVTSPKWRHLPPVDLKGGDFRFRPDGSAAEAIGGNAQFGMVVDDVGRRFLVSNRNPLMHAVAPPTWWSRMPNFSFTDVTQDVSPTGYDAKVHPVSPDFTTSGFTQEFISATHAGTYTSACGIHQFFGEALGPEMQGSWFICEPAQNLIQRQVAEADGPSFRSQGVPADREFIACSDPWFHPVSAWTAPDGALYVSDMYRKFIDHPDYLPADVRPQLDFSAGKNLGRVWRIRSVGASTTNLGNGSAPAGLSGNTAQLVDALGAPNIWTRQTAHRLLLEKNPADVLRLVADKLQAGLVPAWAGAADTEQGKLFEDLAARRQARDPKSGPHLYQARMLQLLFDRFAVLTAEGQERQVSAELKQRIFRIWLWASLAEAPSVREAAWRVMQPLSDSHHPIPDVADDMLRTWAHDPSAAVRFHLAYCLGQSDYPSMTEALVEIVRQDSDNRWTRAVVLSGLQQRQAGFIDALFSELPPSPGRAQKRPVALDGSPGMMAFAYELGRLYGAGSNAELLWGRALAEGATNSAWAMAMLRGLSQGLRQRGAGGTPPLLAMEERLTREKAPTAKLLDQLLEHTASAAGDSHVPLAARTAAIALLGELDYQRAGTALLPLLSPAEPKDVQTAAARALGQFDSAPAAQQLLLPDRWGAYSPALREMVLSGILSRTRQLPALLEAVESGIIPAWAIPSQRRKQLLHHPDPAIRARAERLFAEGDEVGRRQVFEESKPVLAVQGDHQNGHSVFQRVCALCHLYAGEGAKVGPDLTGVKNQRPDVLLLHILVPDAEIYPGFESYQCETKDGRSLSGILVAETASTVTLRRALGEQDTVARDQIISLSANRSSLMPSELEKVMTRQELADLLAFLREGP